MSSVDFLSQYFSDHGQSMKLPTFQRGVAACLKYYNIMHSKDWI